MNEIMTLDKFWDISGRGTARTSFWLEKFCVWDD